MAHAPGMNYTDAARMAREELTFDDGDELAAAALQLALQAWRAAAGADPVWDRFGLELLDVRDRLYPTPPVVAVAEPPPGDGPHTRTTVTELVEALADRHRRVAGDDQRPLAQRLKHDSVAVQLRDAAATLA